MSYAGLRYYQNTTDPVRAKFFGDMQTALTDAIDAAGLLHARAQPDRRRRASTRLLAADAGARALQAGARPHPQDEAATSSPTSSSSFLHDQSVVGAAAWNRLFDETHGRASSSRSAARR